MADPRNRLQVVEEIDDLPSANARPAPPPESPGVSIGATALMLGLKALSQRAAVALEGLATLITAGLVFWLWLSIPNPTVNQLIGMGMFAVFILAINIIARKRL